MDGTQYLIRFLAAALGCLLCSLAGFAQQSGERIMDYHSDITVNADATMRVRETIKVQSLGVSIRHGIYRDIPTRYRDRLGHRYVVDFNIREILRDGAQERYFTKPLANGTRIYIGDAAVDLAPGTYTYTIAYETKRQLGFFKDHDELYWNVNGTDWMFQADHVSATVTLPAGVSSDDIRLTAYTGPQGATGKNYRAEVDPSSARCTFETTQPLDAYENLTIVVGFPKGLVEPPSFEQRTRYFLRDNRVIVWGLGAWLILLAYYLLAWMRIGRDPAKGTIIPRYEPPHNLSPAVIRYLWRKQCDRVSLTATVIDLAVRRLVSISCDEDGAYTVKRTSPFVSRALLPLLAKLNAGKTVLFSAPEKSRITTPDEVQAIMLALQDAGIPMEISEDRARLDTTRCTEITTDMLNLPLEGVAVASGLFRYADTLALNGSCYSEVSYASEYLHDALTNLYQERYDKSNRSVAGTGIALSIILLLILSTQIATNFSFGMALILLLIIGTDVLFFVLLPAVTLQGRKLLDEIEGFRMYLAVTERDQQYLREAPERTPQLFEALLPYAIALEVQYAWVERFVDVLSQQSVDGNPYQPSWYQGDGWDYRHPSILTSAISHSITSAFASATAPLSSSSAGSTTSSSWSPGSSSGFSGGGYSGGGGGSSGGGGGGGGGGGW